LLVLFIAALCQKYKSDTKNNDLTYYSENYKNTNMTILDKSTSDIDAVWVEFHSKDKSKNYTNYS
jgi:hypothetical protein